GREAETWCRGRRGWSLGTCSRATEPRGAFALSPGYQAGLTSPNNALAPRSLALRDVPSFRLRLNRRDGNRLHPGLAGEAPQRWYGTARRGSRAARGMLGR